jgi:uncharacterized OB-fold protein
VSLPPVRADLFEILDGEPRLLAGYSPTSRRYHFPVAEVCPYSGATDVERRHLSSEGTLWAWTAVNVPPPGYRGTVPYGLGVVELPEGLRIVTRLTEADPANLSLGLTMRLTLTQVPTDDGDAVVYAFDAQPHGDDPVGGS